MGYELSIRGRPVKPEEPSLLFRLRTALGVKGDEGAGSFTWQVGESRVVLRSASEPPGAVEAELPFGALDDEIAKATEGLLDAAAAVEAGVFDPQLGRPVARVDASTVSSRFREANAWHVELTGAEDHRQGLDSAVELEASRKPRATLQVKVLLGLAGLGVVAYLLFHSCVIQPMVDQLTGKDDPAAQQGPPAGWISTHPPKVPPGGSDLPP